MKFINYPIKLFFLLTIFLTYSCDDSGSSSFNSGNNTINNQECEPGTIICDGWTEKSCSSMGSWNERQCDINCQTGVGCIGCQDGETYCDGDSVMGCDENNELVFDHDCPESEACVFGECVNRCHPSLLTTSNVGCEFWAVDLDNEVSNAMGMENDAAAQQFGIAIANTNNWPVTVSVYKNLANVGEPINEVLVQPDNGLPMPVTVPANSLVQIDLPQREIDGCMGQNGNYVRYSGSGTFVSPHAYRVVSDGPVVAYQFNPIIQQFSNDASILLPTQSLGYNYYILGYPTANPCGNDMMTDPSIPDHTSVTIVGTQANTTVTIYNTHAITASDGNSGIAIAETPANSQLVLNIGQDDVINLESLQFTGGITECMPPPYDGDFTGTRIQSSAPVAVYSSVERGIGFGGATPPDPPEGSGDGCCTDHLEQQMLPTRALGWNFAISRSPVRSTDPNYKEPDIYRILATEDNTIVHTSLPSPFDTINLNAGEFYPFYAYDGFTVQAEGGAIMVGQFLVSAGYIPGGNGDPTFVLFPAADQHREEYIFLIPTSFEDNYMVLAMPESAAVYVDGNSLGEFQTSCKTDPIGTLDGTNYVQLTCDMAEGVHSVSSDLPVGLTVYGYYNVGSYGYPGGSDLKIINPVE